jgi:hypothetical protein
MRRARVLTALSAVALAGAIVPEGVAASSSPTSENAAATHAYLIATASFEEAELANQAQEIAAREAAAARVSGECPGILANAPARGEAFGLGIVGQGQAGPESRTRPSARAEGERRRQSRQVSELKAELSFALTVPLTPAGRQASAALVRTFTSLRWSNPYVTLLVHAIAAIDAQALEIPAPPVCADMTSWVTSGYKTLTPTTKSIASDTEALLKRSFEVIALGERVHAKTSTNFLAPYENASDRALARHTEALQRRLDKTPDTRSAVLNRLEAAIGLPTEKAPKTKPRKTRPVVIARGKTAAGGSFVARAERSSRTPGVCGVFVMITESSRPVPGLLGALSGEGTGRCLSRSHLTAEPTVHCDSGLLTIEANLLAKARSVQLLLSNGDTITSPAILVPARLGGPAGLYYQAVRGPIPIPVSLTELGASGSALTVLKLPRVVECTKHPVKHFPGGNVLLVHEGPPGMPAFTIRGERFRKLGVEHFELKFEASSEESLFGGSEGGGGFAGSVAVPNGERALEPQASSGCEPRPYAIVYGLLKASDDTVLARVSGNLVPLRKVAIPTREHADGVLVYGAFSPLPTELVIRNASGETVSTRGLAEAARAETESCEGEAEG